MRSLCAMTILLLLNAFQSIVHCEEKVESKKKRVFTHDEMVESYRDLKGLIAIIDEKSTLTLIEGLPRSGSKEYEAEKKKKTIARHGFLFYLKPNKVKKKAVKQLCELLTNDKTFGKFRGFKKCGGFHPDFAMVWKNGNKTIEFQICFGCSEIKIYSEDKAIYCDLPRKEYVKFKKILNEYKNHEIKKKTKE